MHRWVFRYYSFFLRVSLLSLAVCLSGCYVLRQAYYQADLLSKRRGIKEVIADDSIEQSKRNKLSLILKMLDFAKANDLEVGGSYSHYIELNNNVITYLVYAAPKDSLKLKEWWFPVVGNVPYLGFFARADRDAKAAELKSQGFDVDFAGSSGISFLGWIVDPIYSSMIERNEPELANIVFHELAHKTYWYPGDVEFNENLAEFVGVYLTNRFFDGRLQSEEFLNYLAAKRDIVLYKKWLESLKLKLQDLYNQKIELADNVQRVRAKIFEQALIEFQNIQFETDVYTHLGQKKWNNASVAGASLYLPNTSAFQKAFECSAKTTIGKFLISLQKKVKKYKTGERALAAFCQTPT